MRGCICIASPVFLGVICFLVGAGFGGKKPKGRGESWGGAQLPPLSPCPHSLTTFPSSQLHLPLQDLLFASHLDLPLAVKPPPQPRLAWPGALQDPLKLEPLFGPVGPSSQHLMCVSQRLIGMAIR